MQNVRHIAQNACHTTRNDGCTIQNVDQRGGLEKTVEMIFQTLGTKNKKIKSDN